MSKETRAVFNYLFGNLDGSLHLATIDRSTNKKSKIFDDTWVTYPSDIETALDYVGRNAISKDVYFCPNLFFKHKAVKDNIGDSLCIWADLDDCSPDSLLVEPSLVVATSEDRYQAYWRLDSPVPAIDAEVVAKRIAYFHSDEGADKSGWDMTQLLRVPFTFNHKYEGEPQRITLLRSNSKLKYSLSDFSEYPQVEDEVQLEDKDMPNPQAYPRAEEILEENKVNLNPAVYSLFSTTPEEDWSGALWRLEASLLESGLTPEETFIVVRKARCNKYARDDRPEKFLWREVIKAKKHVDSSAKDTGAKHLVVPHKLQPLLTDEEQDWAEKDQDIVKDYIDWATSISDAAPQYHQAGALTILSTLLSGNIRLPTSFGVKVPNLWFLILADTTLTRKSTSMDMAVDMILEIDPDAVLATDGSIEGLMQGMEARPKRPSIFLRDEVTGLIEAVAKKEYYSGMLETFTKLYDGKFQKRILRKETIEVKDPILIFFAGGIKTKMFELLGYSHITSGFIPRFVVITAEADITRLRPLGPPTDSSTDERERIIKTLEVVREHYTAQDTEETSTGRITLNREWNAKLTNDAWAKYNQLDYKMMSDAQESSSPELLTPTMLRLAESGLKTALLLASARKLEDRILVEEQDIVKAFSYVQRWRDHMLHLVSSVGMTTDERKLQNTYQYIRSRGGSVTRSDLMRTMRMNSRDADAILTTLEQRDMVRIKKKGSHERIHAEME